MTDYGSFAQAGGLFTKEQSGSDERDFASTGQELPTGNLVNRLPATSFGQNFPLCSSHITTQLQLPSSNICTPNFEDVRQAAKCFFQATIGDTYGSHGQAVSKWDIYNGEVEDADCAGVLDSLPTSYDDFESKELHLKLERNLSSPLMTCQSPNADSGRVSAGSSLTKSSNVLLGDVANNPPDADDLEVAMINQSFEEQQKQTKLYASPGLKDLFYSQPNIADDRVISKNFESETSSSSNQPLLVVSDTQKSDSNEGSLFTADLLLGSVQTKTVVPKESLTVGSPWTVAQAKSARAEVIETKSETTNSSNITDIASNPLSPITKGDTGFGSDDCESIREFGYNGGSFDVEEMILDDIPLRHASQEAFGNSIGALKAVSDLIESQQNHIKESQGNSVFAVDDGMEATEALAVDVVESLFEGLAEVSSVPEDVSNQDSLKATDEDKNGAANPVTQELNSLVELVDIKTGRESADNEKERKDETVVPDCGAVDSWEELDNDDYSSRLVSEIETAMCKVKIRKPKIDYLAGCATEPWDDKMLPHVLEAYNLPTKFTDADLKQELAKHDCADVSIHPVDDTHRLVVFASKSAAVQAMIAVRQRQSAAFIRLRSLCDAAVITQEKARRNEAFLRPHMQRPQTTPLVARRLVENALGKRSNVSAQQINDERKQLKDAKDLKNAKSAFWHDGP